MASANNSYRSLGYNNASQFAEAFSEPQATIGYVMLGKTSPWDNQDNPPLFEDREYNSFAVYNAMIGGKKILGNDVELVLPRINWTANTVYTAYDDREPNLFASANGQYVYTSSGAVYRCIENGHNGPSTIEPSGDYTVNNGFISLPGDGYVWKYMYAILQSSKFVTSKWIPVPSKQTQSYYGSSNNVIRGSVSRLIVEDGGTGYTNNTTIQLIGTGAGVNATAVIANGNLVSCIVNSMGSGYSYQNCSVNVIGTGSGANVRPVLAPDFGHAFNPAKELGSNTVLISVKVGHPDSTEGGKITTNNDFRQISLVLGPHKYGETTEVDSVTANAAVNMTTGIVLTSGSDFQRDEIVYQGTDLANATYQAIVVDYLLNTVYVNEQLGTLRPGILLKGETSTVSRTVVNAIAPELEPQSGQLVYVENRDAIARAMNQAENIKFVISF